MPLIPRDQKFFGLFNRLASKMSSSSELLHQLFLEPHRVEHFVAAIKVVEHEADIITHDVSHRINTSFVTPFDREDIHNLAQSLDNVVDLIDGTARRVQMFHIAQSQELAADLAGILHRAAATIEKAVIDIKKPDDVILHAREVKRLEEEGDALYHVAVGKLFEGNPQPLEVLKWKELYDTIERAIDSCQTVAMVLESITLKHS